MVPDGEYGAAIYTRMSATHGHRLNIDESGDAKKVQDVGIYSTRPRLLISMAEPTQRDNNW